MNKLCSFVLAMALAIIAFTPTSAKADTLSQQWNETCPTCVPGNPTNSFNSIELFIETSGVTFADTNGATDGWAGTLVNSHYELLTGPETNSVNFNTDLSGLNLASVTIHAYALLNGVVGDGATLTTSDHGGNWAGTSLDASNLSSENTAAPEPSSLIFLGTGLLGLAGMLRRKMAGTAA